MDYLKYIYKPTAFLINLFNSMSNSCKHISEFLERYKQELEAKKGNCNSKANQFTNTGANTDSLVPVDVLKQQIVHCHEVALISLRYTLVTVYVLLAFAITSIFTDTILWVDVDPIIAFGIILVIIELSIYAYQMVKIKYIQNKIYLFYK